MENVSFKFTLFISLKLIEEKQKKISKNKRKYVFKLIINLYAFPKAKTY